MESKPWYEDLVSDRIENDGFWINVLLEKNELDIHERHELHHLIGIQCMNLANYITIEYRSSTHNPEDYEKYNNVCKICSQWIHKIGPAVGKEVKNMEYCDINSIMAILSDISDIAWNEHYKFIKGD